MTTLPINNHLWHIILNTNADEKKCERKWKPVAELLKHRGIRYELHVTRVPGEGTSTAKQLCDNGIRHIVAAGGDGTVNEVVNGIFTSTANPEEVFLAVLPLGRGNDWVRTHHYPKNIAEVVDMWCEGCFIQHDIGKVNTLTSDGQTNSRYFINIAGFGFDADVIYDVTYHSPHIRGFSVYILSLLKSLLSHKPTPINVTAEGEFTFDGEVFMVIAAICQYNGGGIREAKYAVPDDGKFDLIVVPKMRTLQVVKHLKDMRSGDHIDKIKNIRMIQTTSANIQSEHLFRAEAEGELLTTGNYHIELMPNVLNVLSHQQKHL